MIFVPPRLIIKINVYLIISRHLWKLGICDGHSALNVLSTVFMHIMGCTSSSFDQMSTIVKCQNPLNTADCCRYLNSLDDASAG